MAEMLKPGCWQRAEILIPASTSSAGHVFTLWVWVCVITPFCRGDLLKTFETLYQLLIDLSPCWWTDVVIITASDPGPVLVCSWNQNEGRGQRLVWSDLWVLITDDKSWAGMWTCWCKNMTDWETTLYSGNAVSRSAQVQGHCVNVETVLEAQPSSSNTMPPSY